MKRRLFFALSVPAELAEEWAAGFDTAVERCVGPHQSGKLRRVRPAEWHLTLCFLGMTPEESISQLCEEFATRVATCAVPEVVELAAGHFPENGPARVLWWGPREEATSRGALAAIAAAARDAVESVLPGTLGPDHPFHAHLTGARVPRGERGPSPEALLAFEGERFACDWRPAEAQLFESRLGGSGPRYEVLEAFGVGETPRIN